MGAAEYLEKLLGFLGGTDEEVTGEVSERAGETEEEQVKNIIDEASGFADEKREE